MNLDALFTAIARAARDWQDPDYAPREAAVAQTLAAPNRFTEKAIAFAINQQMSLLVEDSLAVWIGDRHGQTVQTVGVIHAGDTPLEGLRDMLAVVLTGHSYLGCLPPESPFLLPAFIHEVMQYAEDVPIAFASVEDVLAEAEALIATGDDEEIEALADDAEALGIDSDHLLLRGTGYAIAVLDGHENDDDLEGIAEDALLYEGQSRRNVALIWAPSEQTPDAFLEGMAAFRSIFPPHPDTPGTLKMQQAFLQATKQPHAYGDGLEFLLSKGAADVQGAGHLRWVPYATLEDVAAWLRTDGDAVQLVVAREAVAAKVSSDHYFVKPGNAHRPALTWDPDGIDAVAFLESL